MGIGRICKPPNGREKLTKMTGPDELSIAVAEASARPEVTRAVRAVYEELGRRVAERRPVCRASGRCCRFEEFGHRLYVTTVELAAFVADLRTTGDRQQQQGVAPLLRTSLPVLGQSAQWNGTGCPYQVDGLCSVHGVRPFGCRVFFCDETSDDWQHEQYEQLHAELKRLHDDLAVPYAYIEWRQALRLLGLSPDRAEL